MRRVVRFMALLLAFLLPALSCAEGAPLTLLEDLRLRVEDVRVQGDICMLRLRDPANGEQFIRKYAISRE